MLRKHKKHTAFTAGCMAVMLTLSVAVMPSPVYAAETVEELEERYNQIEKELKENEKKLQQNAQNQSEQKQAISALESEINGLNSQISLLDQKISLLNGNINALNENIYNLDAEIESINAQITQTKIEIAMSKTSIDLTYQKVLDRLALSYMMGEASDLEILFGAKNLSDMLTRQQYLQNSFQSGFELTQCTHIIRPKYGDGQQSRFHFWRNQICKTRIFQCIYTEIKPNEKNCLLLNSEHWQHLLLALQCQ